MRMRFHTRSIIRDGHRAFIGSQSLREAELDRRRELGLIIHDRDVVHSLLKVFEKDWATLMLRAEDSKAKMQPVARLVKRVAKTVVRHFPLESLVERALKQAVHDVPDVEFGGHKFEHTLEDAVRQAVEDTVSRIVRETVEAEAQN